MSGAGSGVYSARTKPREEHVKFSGSGYVGPIPDGADMDAATSTLRTGVDVPLAIERLSRDVYQSASSAPREDMANEMRSAATAATLHGASPSIRVVANRETRLFSVQGIDTMGCTWDAFARAMAVIGRTTNADPGMPGQMGMGFYANLLLSDTIIFDSHSRETGERFTAMCKGGTEWQVGLVSAPMPEYGARVSMTVHAGVDMAMIKNMVRKCARLSPCPVRMIDERGRWEDLPMFSSAMSLARSSMYGHHYAGAGDDPDAEFSPLPALIGESMRNKDHDGALYLYGKKDGVEVCATFVADFRRVRIDGKPTRVRAMSRGYCPAEAHLVGMPIRLDYGNSGGADRGAFRNAHLITVVVHDERLYRPTADRERFESDSERRVCSKIDEILAEQMAAVRWPRTLAEHLRSPYRAALDAAIDSGERMGTDNYRMAVPPVGRDAHEAAMLGRTLVRNGFDRKMMPLYRAAYMHPRSVLAKKVDARLILAVARHDPSMRVLVTGKADGLAESGFEGIEAYMRRAGLEPLSGDELAEYAGSDEWEAVRASYGQYDASDERIAVSDRQIVYMVRGEPLCGTATLERRRGAISADDRAVMGSEIVAAGSHVGAIVGAAMVSGTRVVVAKLRDRDGNGRVRRGPVLTTDPPAAPHVPDGARVLAEADLLDAAAKAEFDTSAGRMTGDEIAHRGGRIAILQCAASTAGRLAAAIPGSSWFGRPGTLYVACGGRRHFELVSLLGSAGGGRAGRSGAGMPGARGAPLSADRIFRVLAMKRVPESEGRRIMVPAGAPITLADEIGRCSDPQRAALVCGASGGWGTQMDLLLAALEIEDMGVLGALAGSAHSLEDGRTSRVRDVLDDALAADRAIRGRDPAGAEPRARLVAGVPKDAIDAGAKLLDRAERWIVGREGDPKMLALRRASAAEAGARAMGKAYSTNNGAMSGAEIVEAAGRGGGDSGGGGSSAPAVSIVVYGTDAPGLAGAMPASAGRTVAVAGSIDDALELACAVAAAGSKCRIGGENDYNTGWIMRGAGCDDAIADTMALEDVHHSWRHYPAAWHGMLAVRNAGLRSMLAASIDSFLPDDNGEAADINAVVDRFLWLDGRDGPHWRRPEPSGNGSGGSGGENSAAAAGSDGAAARAAAPRVNKDRIAAPEDSSGAADKTR